MFDPLDGSANIEAGLPCGTIFGILRTSGSTREGRTAGPSTIVLPGRRLVAAGYCLYGPSTKLVFTLGEGVFEFTLEGGERNGDGEDAGGLGGGGLNFVLSGSNIRIPRSGNVCVRERERAKKMRNRTEKGDRVCCVLSFFFCFCGLSDVKRHAVFRASAAPISIAFVAVLKVYCRRRQRRKRLVAFARHLAMNTRADYYNATTVDAVKHVAM